MKNLPQPLRVQLTGHTVITSAYQGWAGKLNGDLVELAEDAAFNVMVTADQNLGYQQNMKERKLTLVVLSTPNRTRVLANVARIIAAVNKAEIGGYTFVDWPLAVSKLTLCETLRLWVVAVPVLLFVTLQHSL